MGPLKKVFTRVGESEFGSYEDLMQYRGFWLREAGSVVFHDGLRVLGVEFQPPERSEWVCYERTFVCAGI